MATGSPSSLAVPKHTWSNSLFLPGPGSPLACQYQDSRNSLAIGGTEHEASEVQSLYGVYGNKQFSLNSQLIQLNQ